jgi:ADP-heptose:LPS heptosyltransferase
MPDKILALRFSSLGDVAMTYPVLKTLTETNPGLEVYFVSRPFFKPIFRDLKQVEFIEADLDGRYKGFPGLLRLYKDLKKIRPGIVADLHDVLRTKVLRNLFSWSGKKVYSIDKGRKEKRQLVANPISQCKPLKTTHERYADVFRAAGYSVDLGGFVPLLPALDSQTELFLSPFRGAKIIGIAPLAKHIGKQYPLGGMREVIKLLLEADKDIVVFLFGSRAEAKSLDSINPDPERVFNLSGLFSFDRELQIISRLDLMLSMDSGNGHLAANYGVKVVTVWGVTHPYAGFAPFGQTSGQQILPDLEKYPMLPCSVYGNKICPGYETLWDDVLPEHIAEVVLKNL